MQTEDANGLTSGTGQREREVDALSLRSGDDQPPVNRIPTAAAEVGPQDVPWAPATVQDTVSWARTSVSASSSAQGAGPRSRVAAVLKRVPTWWQSARHSRGAIAAGGAALGAAAALLLSGAAGDHGDHPGFGPRPHLGSAFSDAPRGGGPRP